MILENRILNMHYGKIQSVGPQMTPVFDVFHLEIRYSGTLRKLGAWTL